MFQKLAASWTLWKFLNKLHSFDTFFFQKMEPCSRPLECMPDLKLSSNKQNEVMPRDFQGQFMKQVASTCVPRPPPPSTCVPRPPPPSLVLEEASHHAARTLRSPFKRGLPPETSTQVSLLAPERPSGGRSPGWHLALHLRVDPGSQQHRWAGSHGTSTLEDMTMHLRVVGPV